MTVAIINMRGCWEIAMFQKQKECHYKSWLQGYIQSWLKVCIPCPQIYAFLLCIGG
jgi:hypothetical protein